MAQAAPDIVIYTTSSCPFCQRAKDLLASRGLAYREIAVGTEEDCSEEGARIDVEELVKLTGRRTVPQVVVDGVGIGGFEELLALVNAGKL